MREKIKTFCCALLLLAILPYVITVVWQGKGDGRGSLGREGMIGEEELSQEDAQLLGIVAREMPLSYEKEALKAQAVIARTNLRLAREAGGAEPESLSAQEMERLRRDGGEHYRKLMEAVAETADQTLTQGGQLVAAGYFPVSADVRDLSSPDYLKVIFLEKEEFLQMLAAEFPETAGMDVAAVLSALSQAKRDGLGYVMEAAAGESSLPGERLRSAWGLNSACFYCKEVEGRVRIVTKGLGHGVGMSQFGANEMAKEGKGWEEILGRYFEGVDEALPLLPAF